ncbi:MULTISPECIES: GFA family protein [Methylobacter]|uniref:GFA family protein n=1 Tax=Methylobacter sp. BBA5.1 TaxID=1495064 RepID=UPI0009DFF7DE
MIGSCLCGSVEFEVDGDEFNIYQCHCSLCKKQSGSSSNSATIVKSDNFRFLKASNHIGSWVKETGFRSDFCRKCGSTLPNPLRGLDLYWIPVGLFPVDLKAKVVAHLCTSSISSWHPVSSDIKQFKEVPELALLMRMLHE